MPVILDGQPYIHGLDPTDPNASNSTTADALAHRQNTDVGTTANFFQMGIESAAANTGAVRRGIICDPAGIGPFTAFAWEARQEDGTRTGHWVQCLNVINGDVNNPGNVWNPFGFEPIAENEFATHPDFQTARAAIGYLLGRVGAGTPPVIGGFNPTSGPVGKTVLINGNNFGASTGQVFIGTVRCTVSGWSNSQITLSIPVGAATDKFTVKTSGGQDISRDTFTVTVAATTAKPGPISAPTFTAGNGQGTLQWTAPSDTGNLAISDYEIRFGLSGGVLSVYSHTPRTASNITVSGLTNGTAYDFTVAAVNSKGTGPASAIITGTPVSGSTTAPTKKATTPTGTFNSSNRIYTVDTGSYPTSRLLVSTQYGPYVQATSNTYQVPNQYEGPEYWRFKISASATELESDELLSPAFLAPGNTNLIDLFILLLGIIQSNGTGFAHLDTLSAAELAAINNFLISVFTANPSNPATNPQTYAGAIAPYQVAVNGEGIKKVLIDPTGADSRYQDGFGLDMQYGQRVKASGVTEGIIKKNITRGVTTDNATFGKWNQKLYPEFKEEILQANANFRAAGYNPIPKWLVLDVRESAPSAVADYVSGYQALIQKFQDDGLINSDTKFLIIYQFNSANPDNSRQDALYNTDPTRFIKIIVGNQPTIDGTHGNDIAMKAIGNEVYNKTHNATTPPVVVTPTNPGSGTITDQEPTGPRTPVNYSPAAFGILKTGSNNYYANPPLAAIGGFGRTMLQDAYLAANTSGLVYFQYLNDQAKNGAVGFHTSPNRVALGTMAFGCYEGDNGNLTTVENGAGADTGIAMTPYNYYGVKRVANTGKVTVVTTSDDTLPAAQWTPVLTYGATTKAPLYSVAHLFSGSSQIQNPKSQSLTALVVPTATGKLEFHPGYNDSTSGGIATFDTTGLDLTEITFWFTFTPSLFGSVSGYSSYQELIGFGSNGEPSEGFNITEFPDAGLVMRVHGTNGGYSYSTGGAGQQGGVLLTANTEVLIVGRITAGNLRLWVGSTATPLVSIPAPMLTTSVLPLHLGATYKEDGSIANQTGGIYGRFGLATRGFTDAEVGQVQAANGAISSIAGTVRLFEFANILNSTSVVQDSIDNTKVGLVYSGAL